MEISTIGLDLAKSVFQVHGIDAAGNVLVRKALRRAQMLPFFSKLAPCLVGMEACGTSHHWARVLMQLGHLGKITKMGDKYLRKLLIVGMTSLVRRAKYKPEAVDPRLANWLARKPMHVATVAMANKTARVIWAIMVRSETYRAGHAPALAA
jgi:transposase